MTPQHIEPTLRHHIGARRVWAYDNLLAPSDLAQLHRIVQEAGFTRSEIARPDTADYRHWAAEISLDIAARMPISPAANRVLADFAPGHGYRLYRCYVNVASYGDMLFTHTDCLPGAGELTGLWYICTQWDPEWGGETMFYDDAMDTAAAIQPRPGRFAVFNGEIPHVGRPPNRVCFHPRYTLAMKFERIR